MPASGVTATASVNHSEIYGNYYGVVGDGRSGATIRATISDSVVSGNTKAGVAAIGSSTSVEVLLDQVKLSENLAGLYVSGSNSAILARNISVFDNATGLETANGGRLLTAGNNTVIGNTTNGAFTGTVPPQ